MQKRARGPRESIFIRSASWGRSLAALAVTLAAQALGSGCQRDGGSHCVAGTQGCQCLNDGSCDEGLRCARASGVCQPGGAGSDTSSSGGTGGSGGTDATSSGGSGGGPVFAQGGSSADGGECANVECKPPPCCADSCTGNDDCCVGTVCSADGRCIPENCSYCGQLGCLVDFEGCTAECTRPSCCLDSCASDDDCCAGATCSTTGRCIPEGCGYCSGMRSFCVPTDECDFECVPPPTCGDSCSSDSDCGTGAYCNEFDSGKKFCVPDAFGDSCDACAEGCSFSPGECELTCSAPDASTAAGGSGGTSANGDGQTSTATSNGGTGGSGGSATTSECLSCCAPCNDDADCCTGHCNEEPNSGEKICMPESCEACVHGCSFSCPN